MRKFLLLALSLIVSTVSAWADGPFRNHRYDIFKVLPVTEQSIVFMGNSITNMHDWYEAFDNPNIINRGCSGAVSSELIDNLESVLPGHPKKIFLMIGTNDLGTQGLNTPAQVAAKVRTVLKKCKKESPNTEIYVQSILPTKHGIHKIEDEKASNDSIKKICGEFSVTYVDLFDDLMDITTGKLTMDALHLKASAYRIWCKKIEQYVGSKCVYEDSYTDITGGLGGVTGMRCTYFGMAPVKADDVLLLGDGTINGGEWNELLGTAKVKKRSTGWGGQGTPISTIQSMLPAIFEGNGNKVAPKKILIELGYNETASKTAVDAAIATYKTFLEQVKAKAPNTPIVLLAVYPSPAKDINTTYITPFNEKLKTLAEATDNVTYEEGTYTELVKDGVANQSYFNGGYLYGKGYAKMAQVIAKHVDGATAITDEDAAKRIATFNARTSLSKAIQTAEAIGVGNGVGQYKKEKTEALASAIEEGYTLLAKDGVTDEELNTKATSYTATIKTILASINMPEVSKEGGEEHWYQLYTPYRNNRYTTSQGAGNVLIGGDNTKMKNTMWKFVKREDGSLDIVNRKDGSYINPSAQNNTAISTSATSPSSGWTLSYSDAAGTFIIYSGTAQLNQTIAPSQGNAIYNWGGGSNRSDTGCQIAIVDAPDYEDIEIEPFCGEYEISMEKGDFVNPVKGGSSTSYPNGFVIAKSWQSTSTMPQITFSVPANNMMPSEIYKGNYLMLLPGAKGCTYTLSVNSPCIITGYSFTYSAESAVTITIGDETYKATTEEQQVTVDGIKSASTRFNVGGANIIGKGLILKDFIVKIQTEDYTGDTTGMSTIVSNMQDPTHYYDLQGRRVLTPTKGIFITNQGHKVVIR